MLKHIGVFFLAFLLLSQQSSCQNEGLDVIEKEEETPDVDPDVYDQIMQLVAAVAGDQFLLDMVAVVMASLNQNKTNQATLDGRVLAAMLKPYNISEACGIDIFTMANDYNDGKEYAKRMVTAAGSPPEPSAEFTWNLASFGLYEQCVQVKKGSYDGAPFEAKYCQVGMQIGFEHISIAECVPRSCSSDDLTTIVYTIASFVTTLPPGTDISHQCEEEVGWDGDAIFTLFLCCVFVLCAVIATTYDLIRCKLDKKPKGNVKIQLDNCEATAEEASSLNGAKKAEEANEDGNEVTEVEEASEETPAQPVETKKTNKGNFLDGAVRAFSLVHNTPKIFNTDSRPGSYPALNGIRVLSMFWIILAHTIQFMGYRLDNILYVLLTILPEFYFVTVWNATYAVDTFFLLSGLLLCYLTLKALKKSDGKLNWGLFYFHRWWRITPVYVVALAVWSALLIHLVDGPGANQTFMGARQMCRDNWWANLLYFNNLYPFPGNINKLCMGWSWYLAVDMQFFIITPPLLILLYKRPRIGLAAVAGVCVASFITTASLVSYWGLKAGLNQGFYNERSAADPGADRIYAKPYTRISPYMVGIVTGYIMYKYNGRRPQIPKWGLAIGWSISIILGMSVIFGVWKSKDTELAQGAAVMYHTFSRFSFALAVAWVVLVCVFDYGGPVNAFLSWGIWAPFARLTFCAYLLHPVLLFVFVFPSKTLFHYAGIQVFFNFVATTVLSYAAAFVLSVLVEAPSMGLEKMFFRKK